MKGKNPWIKEVLKHWKKNKSKKGYTYKQAMKDAKKSYSKKKK